MRFLNFFTISCIAIFAISFYIDVFSHPVFAQSSAGITLIPATIEKRGDVGSVLSETLKVTNESSEDKEYYIYKRDIKGVEGGGVPIFAEENIEKTGFEMSEWISFQETRVSVPARNSIEIPVTITIPSDASPGSHFAGIFVSAEPPRLRENGASVGYEVASIVSIRINGDVIDTARIRAFSTDKLFYGMKNVRFVAKVENQGNILIRPHGPVTITSMFGASDVITVNENLAGVFPGTTRDIEFNWKSDGIGFGKYEAIVALTYDGNNGQKTIDATLIFWVFPVKIMLLILGGFMAIFAIGYMSIKYYVRQTIMRASGGRYIATQKNRKKMGISKFLFICISVLTVTAMFFIVLLMFIA